MVARTLSPTQGDAATWTVRVAGLGSGLLVVLGAILLGWLAWPALLGGLIGGTALLALLAARGRTNPVSYGVAQVPHRSIRAQAPAASTRPHTRIAA
jgi:hypothetical protein